MNSVALGKLWKVLQEISFVLEENKLRANLVS